jgi:hypothetical protein
LLDVGGTFLKSLKGIRNNPSLVDINQHSSWWSMSVLMTWFWVATCVKECSLWEIKWDMQLNTHGPVVISLRRKTKGSWGIDIG